MRSSQVPAVVRSTASGVPLAGFQVLITVPAGFSSCTVPVPAQVVTASSSRSPAAAARLHSAPVAGPAASASTRAVSGWRSRRWPAGTWRASKRTSAVVPSAAPETRTRYWPAGRYSRRSVAAEALLSELLDSCVPLGVSTCTVAWPAWALRFCSSTQPASAIDRRRSRTSRRVASVVTVVSFHARGPDPDEG